MSEGFWGIIGGVIAGAFITVLVDPIRAFLLGPRIRLVFRSDAYGRVKTTELHLHEAELPTAQSFVRQTISRFTKDVEYVRLQVENGHRGMLKGCRGFLTDIEEKRGSVFVRVYFDSVQLCWAYVGAAAVDIPHGSKFNLDIFSTEKDVESFKLQLASVPKCYQQLCRTPGEYRLTVLVTAENANAKLHKLNFKWTGVWDEFEVKDIPERDW